MRRILLMFFKLWGFHKLIRMVWGAKHKTYEENYEYLQEVTRKAIKAGHVNAEYHGLENIPEENGFVYFPNHQGMFDVLMLLASSPKPFSFIMKKEAKDLPIVREVAMGLRALAIDRDDVRQAMTVINEMTENIKLGYNYVIFPEGTRSRKKNAMNEMKGGSFKSAYRAKAPIVPCALLGAYKPFDSKSIKPVDVALYYLPPMYYEEYKDMKTVEIAAEVRRRIEAKIKEVTDSDTRFEKPIDNE